MRAAATAEAVDDAEDAACPKRLPHEFKWWPQDDRGLFRDESTQLGLDGTPVETVDELYQVAEPARYLFETTLSSFLRRMAYEDDEDVHLVMDRCTGGTIFDRLQEGGGDPGGGLYSERQAAQVLKSVRYRSKAEQANQGRGAGQKVHSSVIEPEADVENNESNEVFQKNAPTLFSGEDQEAKEYLTLDFLKKYLKYVKEAYEPVLTKEAVSALTRNYVRMREMAAGAENKEGTILIL